MLRRKLFVYTIMLIVGIISAYYVFEKSLWLGFGILFATIIAVKASDTSDENIPDKKHYLTIMLSIALFGFGIFYLNYSSYDGLFRVQENNEIKYTRPQEVSCILGKISQVKIKDDGFKLTINCDRPNQNTRVLINYYGDFENENAYELVGDRIEAQGKLKLPDSATNPACFDYALYLKSQRIEFLFTARSIKILKTGDSYIDKFNKFIIAKRERFLLNFDEESRGFIRGVLFGDKSEIDDETISQFNNNSTGHILAVSGLHIGFLFTLLKIFTKKRRTLGMYIAICLVVLVYGEMTLWSPSTIRAVLVMIISLFSMHLRRRADLLSSVSFASFILLISNPYNLFSTGFQMSFLAMIGITFLGGTLQYIFGDYFAMLIAVQAFVAPISASIFHRFNIMSIFINIPVVFLASILVPFCIIVLGMVFILGDAPEILIKSLEGLSDMVIWCNQKLGFNGAFSEQAVSQNTGVLILIYLILMLICSEWTRIKILRREFRIIAKNAALILLPCIFLILSSQNFFTNDEVVFIDVGQGDSVHIREKRFDILIDGGGNTNYNIGQKVLEPYLLSNRVKNMDMAIVTHLHTDHYLGIYQLREIYSVEKLAAPAICEGDANWPSDALKLRIGDTIKLSDRLTIECIWPQNNRKTSSNNNENNMIYIAYIDSVKIMITGDIVEEDEIDMIKYYRGSDKLSCDVLQVPHHGSKSSTSDELLDAVNPRLAVIQVGKDNMYGHPHQDTLDRLNKHQIPVLRTDLSGAIGLDINKDKIKIDTVKDYHGVQRI